MIYEVRGICYNKHKIDLETESTEKIFINLLYLKYL